MVREVDDDRFLQHRVQKISIFMNVFNVHVNRIPYTGTVERVMLSPGKFYAADKDKAVLHNEFCAITLATPDNQRYTSGADRRPDRPPHRLPGGKRRRSHGRASVSA